MVLESTMLVLDNSEYMRNGDYTPSRMEAQHDAANLLVGTKTQNNPENSVGVLTSVNSELLISPTDDMGKILSALHGVPVTATSGNGIDIPAAVQVAHLALKHRRNKNGGQRVVVFVGSPVTCDAKVLAKAGRQLKKNNIAVDVVLMGENEGNEEKMRELVKAANGAQDNCHLVSIPPGVMASDVLVSSPILHGGSEGGAGGEGVDVATSGAGSGGAATAGGMDFAEFGGVDPNMDPELAMALRVSMEEERSRQQRAATATNTSNDNEMNEDGNEGVAAEATDSAMDVDQPVSDVGGIAAEREDQSEEDMLLQQALAMSMNEDNTETGIEQTMSGRLDGVAASTEDMDEDEDDAAMQMALQMSMQPDAETEPTNVAQQQGQQQFQDPAFVSQLLGSLPGVDPNDPVIKNALKNLNQQSTDDKSSDNENDKNGSNDEKDANK